MLLWGIQDNDTCIRAGRMLSCLSETYHAITFIILKQKMCDHVQNKEC